MSPTISRSLVATGLLLALAAFLALTTLAGAKDTFIYAAPPGGAEAFAESCLSRGGDLIEITNDKGDVLESNCFFGKDDYESCGWAEQLCEETVRETRGGGIGGPVEDGVVDGGPRSTQPVLDGGR